MKVLFLPKWYPNKNDVQYGIFIKNQVDAIAKKGVNTAVLFVITSELVEKEEITIAKNENLIEIIIYFPKKGNRLLALFSYYKSFKKGVAILNREWGNPNAVILYILGRNYYLFTRFFSNAKMIVSEQWSGFLNGNFEKYISAKKKNTISALRKADEVIVVSPELKNAVEKIIPNKTIHVIPNIVFSSGVKLNTIQSDIKILTVADVDDSIKNLSGIGEALSKLPNEKIHWKIIGEGKDEARLKEKFKSLSNENLIIEFVKRMPHKELLKQYAWSNFFILNSYKETFNVAAAESCAAGRPVVATRCGGPESFLNDKNSVLVNVNDVGDLLRGIKEMIEKLRSNTWNEQIITQTINQSYGAETVAKQYITVIESALNKKNN